MPRISCLLCACNSASTQRNHPPQPGASFLLYWVYWSKDAAWSSAYHTEHSEHWGEESEITVLSKS